MVLAIHGGAGDVPPGGHTRQQERTLREALLEIVQYAFRLLERGETALDAVEQATRMLEDCPLYNAGRGAAFTSQGTHELDASVMCGKTLQAGAVALVRNVRHPISLARAILEHSPHLMLAAESAEQFAWETGLELVPNRFFSTPGKWQELQRLLNSQNTPRPVDKGTAGAVALDSWGNLAAATSTGGLTGKMPGRIGDSPLIGAGTYANNQSCAVSCTGDGEQLIRVVAAHEVASLIRHKQLPLGEACQQVLNQIHPLGGDAGIMALDGSGNLCFRHNTARFYRGWIRSGENPEASLY